MKDTTDTDRVLLTLDVNPLKAGGRFVGFLQTQHPSWAYAWSVEPQGADWWTTAEDKLSPNRIRFRWRGPRDFYPNLPETLNPDPPEWVDVIMRGEGDSFIRVRLRLTDDGVKRDAVEVYDGSGSVTTRLLRRVGQGHLLDRLDDLLTEPTVDRILGSGWRRRVERPGRAGRPDSFYAEWAKRYVEALHADPKRPIQRLIEAEKQDGRFVTADQIRAYLYKARSRGLLTRSEPGKAGGSLTRKAVRVLRTAGIEVDT